MGIRVNSSAISFNFDVRRIQLNGMEVVFDRNVKEYITYGSKFPENLADLYGGR